MVSPTRYRFTIPFTLGWVGALIRGRRRCLAGDSARCLGATRAWPRVEGGTHVPRECSVVLVANHYQRPGLWVGWSTMAATVAVAERRPDTRWSLHWLITAEWPVVVAGRRFSNPLLHLLFTRLARLYAMIALPALEGQVEGRASAVRAAAATVTRRGPHHVLGIFPEGRTGTGLLEAQPGSGDFLFLLWRAGVPIIPCGVSEEQGRLVVRFGPAMDLALARGRDRAARDRQARTAAMVEIGRLLPHALWGAYDREIASAAAETTNQA